MSRITPFLWFDHAAEEAANHYVSIFPNSRILNVTRFGDAGNGPKGSVMTVTFELDGLELTALNGGPTFRLTEAFSLSVSCATQAEVDTLWTRLSAGGAPGRCGWLKDKYGLSWQIVPAVLHELLGDPDPARARRVTEAMLTMDKLDIQLLQRAHRGA